MIKNSLDHRARDKHNNNEIVYIYTIIVGSFVFLFIVITFSFVYHHSFYLSPITFTMNTKFATLFFLFFKIIQKIRQFLFWSLLIHGKY